MSVYQIDLAGGPGSLNVVIGDEVDFVNSGNRTLTAYFPVSPFRPPRDRFTVPPGGMDEDDIVGPPGIYPYEVTPTNGARALGRTRSAIIVRGDLVEAKRAKAKGGPKKGTSKKSSQRAAKAKKRGKAVRKARAKKR